MPPKSKDGKDKKKAGKRPAWMDEGMWALSQNLPKLNEYWTGDVKDTKSKTEKVPMPTITRTQAGLLILQQIFPANKAGKENREACIKLGMVETSMKVLASQKAPDMVSAAQILMVMTDTFDQQRQVDITIDKTLQMHPDVAVTECIRSTALQLMMDSKPTVIPQLLTALTNQDSAPLRAAICGLLRVIATHDDTRPRLWRQLKDWDWSHLITCLSMQDLSQLGGRNAAHDAMAVLEAMCSAPEGEVGSLCCNHVVNAGGIQAIVKVLTTRVSHPMARAAGVAVLNQIMRRAASNVCEEVMQATGGLQPIIGLLSLPIVPLKYKAHAAAALLRFIMPDSLWRNSHVLPGGVRPNTAVMTSSSVTAANNAAGLDGTTTTPHVALPSMDGAAVASTTGASGGGVATAMKVEVAHSLEAGGLKQQRAASAMAGGSRPGTVNSMQQEPAVPDDHFLDEATKADIAKRAKVVAESDAIPPLIALCKGPDGPLPDLEKKAAEAAAGDADKAKAKPKKKVSKKKAKLEPGMAEAQTWASAVLRMISLDAEQRQAVVFAGAVRFLMPLLESKVHPARWNARQTLINLSMTPALVPHLMLYKVPEYIHNSNIPARHYDRPFPSSGIEEQKIPAHLAGAVAAAQKDIQARGPTTPGVTLTQPGALRPPALKSSSKASLANPAPKTPGATVTLVAD